MPALEPVQVSAPDLRELYRYLEIDAKLENPGGPLRRIIRERYIKNPRPNSRMAEIYIGTWRLAVCHQYKATGSAVWNRPDPKWIAMEPVSFFLVGEEEG